jgi:hypothetical protein
MLNACGGQLEDWLGVSGRTKERRCGGGVTRASASIRDNVRRVYGGGIEVVAACWETHIYLRVL